MEGKTVEEALQCVPDFVDNVPEEYQLANVPLTTLQVNVGYMCNLACRHCHLQCSPTRKEMMSRETLQACLDAFEAGGFSSMDITGGAPEMHPDYEWFLGEAHARGIKPICRTNLCILNEERYAKFAELYAAYDVTVVASMPYFSERNVDKVRGKGVFEESIKVLKRLNSLGVGTGEHALTFVFNPSGAVMPPDQASMEREYRTRFKEDFGIEFTNLIAITNNPSGRFAEALNAKGKLEKYVQKLYANFNAATLEGMMCRGQISVDWQGKVYDCDFNQAIGLECSDGKTIFDYATQAPGRRRICFKNHCYGCTAGAGSSCGGTTA